MKCQECEQSCRVLKYDPRDPPLDDVPCVCTDCYRNLAEEVIEELQDRISELKGSLGLI